MSYKPYSNWLRPCTRVWLLLLLLTFIAFFSGQLMLGGRIVMSIILLATILKGTLIADYFMDLRNTRLLWRMLIWGWLIVVAGAVSLAYSLAD